MKGRGWIAIALLVPMFAGCIDLGGSLSAPAPIWESGYTFAYVDTATYDVSVDANGEHEDESGSEGPLHYTAEVVNTTLGGEEPVYIVAYKGSPMSTGFADSVASMEHVWLLALRQRDLAPVGQYVTGCYQDAECAATGLQSLGTPKEYTYLDFPLTKGKSWGGMVGEAGDQEGGEFFDDDVGLRYDANVRGSETVATPLGEIRTVRVDFQYRLVGIEQMREEMERAMRESGGSVKRFTMDMDAREQVYYSPEYQTIAKSVHDVNILIDLAFQPRGSEAIEVRVDVHIHVESVLEGATFIAKPERDADDMTRVAAGLVPLGDAKGVAMRPAGYSLNVAASDSIVNAAEEESVKFTGSVHGSTALPADHKTSWRIEDYENKPVASGDGLLFSHTFTEPGQYRAIVEAKDANGTLTAVDVAFVSAEYHAKVTATCPVASLEPVLPPCDAVDVPVRPGIQSLTVRALRSGATANPVSPELRVRDAAGNQARQSGNIVTIDDFSGFDVGSEDWVAEYYHAGVAMSDVEYQIDLEYASASIAKPSAAGMGGLGGLAFNDWILELIDARSAAEILAQTHGRLFA